MKIVASTKLTRAQKAMNESIVYGKTSQKTFEEAGTVAAEGEGKKTLPVLAALAAPVPAAAELADLLTTSRADEAELRRAAALIEKAGGRRFAERESQHHLERGLACLAEADTGGTARDPLLALIDYLGRRTS